MAVTFTHASGRVVTVSEETRVARLLAEQDDWTKQAESKRERGSANDAGDATRNTGRRRGAARKRTDASATDEG